MPDDAPSDTGPRFDRDLIEQYRSVIGADGSRQMVDLFLTTYTERRAEMAAALAADDLAEIRRVGHAMKGMSAAVGAARLAGVGERLQHAEADDVASLIEQLDAESADVVEELAAGWGLDGSVPASD